MGQTNRPLGLGKRAVPQGSHQPRGEATRWDGRRPECRWRGATCGARTAGAGAERPPAPRCHLPNWTNLAGCRLGLATPHHDEIRPLCTCHPQPKNHLAPKTSTDQLRMRPATQHRMKAALGDDRPTPPPTHRARVANAPTPRPARDGPPWHHGILSNETPMLPSRLATPAARDDVAARMSGTGRAESRLGSCPTNQPRASQHQLEHIYMLAGMRQVVQSMLQHGQWNFAPPSRCWCHRAAQTRHQRATGVSTSPHTRQRSERTTDIANAPFWQRRL